MRVTKAFVGLSLLGVLLSGCSEPNPAAPEGASGSGNQYSLLPPGARLDSAHLLLNICMPQGQTVVVHPQQSAWTEQTATWSQIGSALSPFVLATFRALDTGVTRVDVSGVVRLWLDGTWANFGLLLDQNAPEYLRTMYHSRESHRRGPRLTLYCSMADSFPVYSFSAVADAMLDAAAPASNFGSDSLLQTGWTSTEPGERRTLIAFNLLAPETKPISRLGDRVWLDTDRDGSQDALEQGVFGVMVKLLDCSGHLINQTITNTNGQYAFDSLDAGSYRLEFVHPDGYVFTEPNQADSDLLDSDVDPETGQSACVNLPEATDDFSIDAGLTEVVIEPPQPAKIGDRVWLDVNGNGLQEAEEPGQPGVTVEVWACGGDVLGSAVSGEDGGYLFNTVPAGSYTLRFVCPEGYEFTLQDAAGSDLEDSDVDSAGLTLCFEVAEGTEDLGRDAGLVPIVVEPEPRSAAGDRVWNDLNVNGIQDDGEPGMAGVEVELLNCDQVVVASTVTGAEGAYGFHSLPAGSYQLRFAAPAGYHFSPQVDGSWDTNSDADPVSGLTECFELSQDETDNSRDAGLYVPAAEPAGCTRTRSFWKDHSGQNGDPDWVSEHLPIRLGADGGAKSIVVEDAATAARILGLCIMGGYDNGITRLYAELLAARLNIAEGASPAEIEGTLQAVDQFLAGTCWQDWCNLNSATRCQVSVWRDTLNNWNRGLTGPGACVD